MPLCAKVNQKQNLLQWWRHVDDKFREKQGKPREEQRNATKRESKLLKAFSSPPLEAPTRV